MEHRIPGNTKVMSPEAHARLHEMNPHIYCQSVPKAKRSHMAMLAILAALALTLLLVYIAGMLANPDGRLMQAANNYAKDYDELIRLLAVMMFVAGFAFSRLLRRLVIWIRKG